MLALQARGKEGSVCGRDLKVSIQRNKRTYGNDIVGENYPALSNTLWRAGPRNMTGSPI